jgi:hypothetical protein
LVAFGARRDDVARTELIMLLIPQFGDALGAPRWFSRVPSR